MTDQTIPADKVRDLRDQYARLIEDAGTKEAQAYYGHVVDDLDALLPSPPRPTLADMNEEERAACRWMQCGYAGETVDAQSPGVIGYFNHDEKKAVILTAKCGIVRRDYDRVTPRPDLPRMEWPGTGQDGEEATKVDYVSVAGGRTAYGPWTVARLRKKPAPAPAPPNTLTEGSEWDNVDALARACEESGRDQIVVADKDGDVFVWGVDAEWWETGLPGCDYAPHTIIHAGKKADQ